MSGGAPAEAAALVSVARLIERGTFAVASFTDSGGPLPGTGGKGRIVGPQPKSVEERSSLAALYCALMCDQSLQAIGSRARIIVDGPFAENAVFLAALAALRQPQPVLASDLRDGTTAGAAVLALMAPEGKVPHVAMNLRPQPPANLPALDRYRREWLAHSSASASDI